MFANPLADNLPAVRKPVFEIGLGDPAAWNQHLVSLTVDLGWGPAVDCARLRFAAPGSTGGAGGLGGLTGGLTGGGDSPPEVALGDEGAVALGYHDEGSSDVISGRVTAVRRDLRGAVQVTLTNGGAALAKLRLNQSYAQQNAGDLVRDWAGQADVATGTIEDGPELAFFALDDRRSVFHVIHELAVASGYLTTFQPDGALDFAPPATGPSVQSFAYGLDILALEHRETEVIVEGFTVVGEGAAGAQGADAWPWLLNDASAVTSQAGQGGRVLAHAALRSADAVQTAAQARLQFAAYTREVATLLVPGSPAVRPGGLVDITDAPQDSLNGEFLVRSVRHRYAKTTGFTTHLSLAKAGDAGLGGLGGFL